MSQKFLSDVVLSTLTAGSMLKLDSNGKIVEAVDGTDYISTSATGYFTASSGSGIYYSGDVRIGTYQTAVAPDAKLHIFDYQTTEPKLLIEDGNTGDASMQFKISTQSYTLGIDNSDSDKFVLSAGGVLGTGNLLEITSGGLAAFQNSVLVKGTLYVDNQEQIQQGETEKIATFQNLGTERGYFEVTDTGKGYFYADGFKTGATTVGFLKSDGTVESGSLSDFAAANHTHSSLSGTSNDLITITSTYQADQGEAIIQFNNGSTEIGRFDTGGYFQATGFKTSTAATGFLKADGTVDTNTYAASGHNHDSSYVLSTGGYYDESFSWDGTHDFMSDIKVSGASATTTNTTALFYGTGGIVEKRDLGSAAFASTGDFDAAGTGASEASAVQDNLDSLSGSLGTAAYTASTNYATASHNHDGRYYTKSESDGKYAVSGDNFAPILADGFYQQTTEGVVLATSNTYRGLAFPNGGKNFVFEVSIKGNANANHQGIFWGLNTLESIYNNNETGYKLTHQGEQQLHIRDIAGNANQLTYAAPFAPNDQQWHRYKLIQYYNVTEERFVFKVYIDGIKAFDVPQGAFNAPPQQPTYFGFINYTGDVEFSNWNVREITGEEDLLIAMGQGVFQPAGNYLTNLPAHHHDARYYTETEMDTFLAGKLSTSGGTIAKTTNTTGTTGTTFLEIANNVGSDISQQQSFIDFKFTDTNANFTPQVRIGAQVGRNADANAISKEGAGAFVVYTGNGTDESGGGALTEAMRIGWDNKLIVQGEIQASGYNKTSWDTAYGWGNHADEPYATTDYVDTAVSNLVDTAPAALNTLNELAAALGDDENFSTTVSNNIGAVNQRVADLEPVVGANTTDIATNRTEITNLAAAIPTNNNQLTNGAGYITSADGGNAATLEGRRANDFLKANDTPLSNTDLDTLYDDDSTLYYSNSEYNTNTNIPFDNYFTLLNFRNPYGDNTGDPANSNDRASQLWLGDTPNKFYVRYHQGTSTGWHSWERVWTTHSFSDTNVSNWNTAYGWGNHAGLYDASGSAATAEGNAIAHSDARIETEVFPALDDLGSAAVLKTGSTITGQVIFPSAATTKPVLPNGFISRNDSNDTTGRHDIWGISERYYPSNSTAGDAWGIQWSGTPNDIVFVGGGEDKVTISLDEGDVTTLGTVTASGGNSSQWNTAYGWGDHAGLYDAAGSAATAEGNAIAHTDNRIETEILPAIDTVSSSIPTNNNQLTNGAGYITAVPSTFDATSIGIGSKVTISESTDRADLLYINSHTSGWGGLQIGNTSNEFIFSLMGNGNAGGIYDDQNGDWIIYWDENAGVQLHHNSNTKLQTVSDGVNITGRLYASSGIQVPYGGGEHRPMVVLSGATNYGLFHTEATNDEFTFDFNGDQKFKFSQDGILTVNGNTVTTGKITNWDTAFGWGNHASAGYFRTSANTHLLMNNFNITGVNHITINDAGFGEGIQWGNMMISESPDDLSNGAGNLQISNTGDPSIRVTIDPNGNLYPSRDRLHLLGLETNRWQVVFCEILDSAGQHEKNLQNPEGEKSVGEYETGTVLVWKGGKNLPCTEAADHMRMGIAVKGIDSPLIQGAEPVLVTGSVKEGDYLVTSRKEGHAEAISPEFMRQHGLYDCVLGKALESAEGESHLVKTWINI